MLQINNFHISEENNHFNILLEEVLVNRVHSLDAAIRWASNPKIYQCEYDSFWWFTLSDTGERHLFKSSLASKIARAITGDDE
jgi:hypothetical protein